MHRITRSILVLSFVVVLNAPIVNARTINDDQDPGSAVTRIVKKIRGIIRVIVKPLEDGELLPPKP
jgi:acid phosphatase class B